MRNPTAPVFGSFPPSRVRRPVLVPSADVVRRPGRERRASYPSASQALSGTPSDEMNVSVPLAFTQCCPGDDFTGMPSEVVHVYWSRRHSKIEHFIAFVEGLGCHSWGNRSSPPIPLWLIPDIALWFVRSGYFRVPNRNRKSL